MSQIDTNMNTPMRKSYFGHTGWLWLATGCLAPGVPFRFSNLTLSLSLHTDQIRRLLCQHIVYYFGRRPYSIKPILPTQLSFAALPLTGARLLTIPCSGWRNCGNKGGGEQTNDYKTMSRLTTIDIFCKDTHTYLFWDMYPSTSHAQAKHGHPNMSHRDTMLLIWQQATYP